MNEPRNYDNTLNLPRTDLPMKAGLAKKEPEIRRRWEEMDLYGALCRSRRGRPKFILHDGPPYANGDVHVGTGQNKILKDIVVRYKFLRNYYAPYVPGWDCHGLPIERKVLAELGEEAKRAAPAKIRERCRTFAERYLEIQRAQFKSLGCLGDWSRPYRTMDPSYEVAILEVFEALWDRGHIQRRLFPVHWCIYDETALAEAELEYKPKPSPSIYLRFPVVTDIRAVFPGSPKADADLVVWTTTPWTLPADLAVAIHPQYEYALVEYPRGLAVVCESLVEKLAGILGLGRTLGKVRGEALRPLQYRHPLSDRVCPVLPARYVTLADGTGLVHTAPGHGVEDFHTGLEFGLETFSPVGPDGRFTPEAGPYQGLRVFEANEAICRDLEKSGILLRRDSIEHSYPHCWRCKSPVIFRATEQWFVLIDHREGRAKALEAVAATRWFPSWGEARISSMLRDRPDWCISRQRTWGVPIPGLYCSRCSRLCVTSASLAAIKAMVARNGADGWFRLDSAEFLPSDLACSACGHKSFRKETDIFDVWFESGCSHRAVAMAHPELGFPSDLYLEGTDQHRGWFQVSLLASLFSNGHAPFRSVLTHGFLVDPTTGDKIAKSRPEYMKPVDQIVATEGADLVRLWLASINYTEDMPFSFEILRTKQEPYRKIRNTFRFLLGNTFDFSPEDAVVPKDMRLVDRCLVAQLDRLIREVTAHYDEFEFFKAYHKLFTFADTTLSALYFDMLKGRLYTYGAASRERRSAQTALRRILEALVKMYAPILAHTSEEVWGYVREPREAGSVHLTLWPEPSGEDPVFSRDWAELLVVRERVTRELEKLRQEGKIGKSTDAAITLERSATLEKYFPELPEFFIVSEVRFGPSLDARPSSHPRCSRCWTREPTVGPGGLCDRCRRLVG